MGLIWGPKRDPFGDPFWFGAHLGPIWGPILRDDHFIWGPFGTPLGPILFGAHLGPVWSPFYLVWGPFGAHFNLGSFLGPFREVQR